MVRSGLMFLAGALRRSKHFCALAMKKISVKGVLLRGSWA